MKILKRGNYSNLFPMVITCQRVEDEYGFAYGDKKDFCNSELEIDVDDIKKHKWSKYPNYERIDYGVICPVCNNFVVINKKLIPENILKVAKEIQLNN